MKICIVETTSLSCFRFRTALIKKLIEEKEDVFVVAGDSKYFSLIEQNGVKCICLPLSNRSLNPFSSLRYFFSLNRLFRCHQFDAVLTFQLKPNCFGCFAAKRNDVKKVIATVEGLGDSFVNKGVKWKIIRMIVIVLYRISLRKIDNIVCLNQESITELLRCKVGTKKQYILMHGIGVDTNYYRFSPIINFDSFLMASRLIHSKGVIEYCKAAQYCKDVFGMNCHFLLVGDYGNLKFKDIAKYIENDSIEYLGFKSEMLPLFKRCFCFVLPSYYGEGVPMSIMEAMSVGRPIITTDWVGCRETVDNNVNGYLVNPKDFLSLAQAMRKMYLNKKGAIEMGRGSRLKALKEFKSDDICQKYIGLIHH